MQHLPVATENNTDDWVGLVEPTHKVDAVHWCMEHESLGRYQFFRRKWFFEFTDDAVWFSLQGF